MPLVIDLNNEQQARVTLNPVTAAGNPSAIDGLPTVDVLGGDGVAEVISATEIVFKSGSPGTPCVFQVNADADLGAGVVPISDTVTLNVSFAQAAALGLNAVAIEPKS